MIEHLPMLILLSIFMITFGYIAGNSRNFNFWKFCVLAVIVVPIILRLGGHDLYLYTMCIAFGVGYLLPYAPNLEGFTTAISNAINAVRYKSAYEDIKKKQEEIDALRKEYQKQQQEQNKKQREQEQKRRQEESERYRQSQQNKQQKTGGSQSSGGSKSNQGGSSRSHSDQEESKQQQSNGQGSSNNQNSSNSSSSQTNSKRNKYLIILGLKPDKEYSNEDIKKAYRRQAMKYHPDKHAKASESVVKEMNERFKEVVRAYEWLGKNSVN